MGILIVMLLLIGGIVGFLFLASNFSTINTIVATVNSTTTNMTQYDGLNETVAAMPFLLIVAFVGVLIIVGVVYLKKHGLF